VIRQGKRGRVDHEYGPTHGISKTGCAGMGTVAKYGTCDQTVTHTRGFTVFDRLATTIGLYALRYVSPLI
jgi:hypothetical protein